MELLHLLASLQILPWLVSPAALLSPPMVIVDPKHPVYFPGERLTLRCSAPGREVVTSYHFYNQIGEQVHTETTGLSGGPWLVLTAETGKAGVYSCEYWAVRDGRHIYSARSQPVLVPVMDHPAAPFISATVGGPWNDSVTIACSLPGSYMSTTFQMLKNGHIVLLESTPSSQGVRLQLHTADPDIAGSYTCSYEIDMSGRKMQSNLSSPFSIHLPAPPGAPSLSLSPQFTMYLPGETVTLTCSVPPGAHTVTGFQFSKDSGRRVSHGSSNMHTLSLMGPGDSGSYTCAYWIHPSSWGIRSGESQPVSISITDPPPQPVLSVDPPSGAVIEGLPLLITCTAPENTGERRFHFYKDGDKLIPGDVGSEITSMEPGTSSMNVSVLSIPQASPESTGEFTCGYEENISRRWIPSPSSRAVNITVTAKASPGSIQAWPPWLPLVAECVGAAALLPLLLLLVCLCRRRKGDVAAETQPMYVNRPSGAGTALQEWSREGQVQPVTHTQPVQPKNPGGKPVVGQNPQERGKREVDADVRVINTVYSTPTPPSSIAHQRGGKYVSEAVVYSKISS